MKYAVLFVLSLLVTGCFDSENPCYSLIHECQSTKCYLRGLSVEAYHACEDKCVDDAMHSSCASAH